MNYINILDELAGAGIDVAFPGAKQGICAAPYVVVQNMGTHRFAQSDGLGYSLYEVHCYVPLADYRLLPLLIERVKAALQPLAPDLRPVGDERVHLINDRFRAHEGSVQYLVQRRLTYSERND